MMVEPTLRDTVTLVIPAHGRPELTRRLLRSLQDRRATYEIILVDDATIPPLEGVVREYAELPVRYLHCPRNAGPAAARNLGVWLARTPLVAFTDNDVAVDPGWMEALVSHLLKAPPDVAGVGGRVLDDDRTLVGQYSTRLRLLDPFSYRGRVVYLVTANCLFRRSALIEVGGFREAFRVPGGEDPDLSFRLLRAGYRLEEEPTAVVRHAYGRSWSAFLRMFVRYGRGCRMAMETLSGGGEDHGPEGKT